MQIKDMEYQTAIKDYKQIVHGYQEIMNYARKNKIIKFR